jgi:hypothetical protein
MGKANIPDVGVIAKHQKLEIPGYDEGFDQLYYVMIGPNSSEFVVKEWQDEV